MGEQKQFQPTTKKIKEARKKGNVLKSPLLTKGLAGAGGVATLFIFNAFSWERNRMLLEYSLLSSFDSPLVLFGLWAGILIRGLVFVLSVAVLLSITVEFIQVGSLFYMSLALPDSKRINPAEGMKKLASGLRQVLELVFRVVFVVLMYWLFLHNEITGVIIDQFIYQRSTEVFWGGIVRRTIIVATVIIIILGFIEFILKRRSYYRDLSMSLDDVRRESKEDEGSPEMKSQRSALHQAISNQDLVKRVRASKVIIIESHNNHNLNFEKHK